MARKTDEESRMDWDARDWLSDHAVSRCAPATRGIWKDLLDAMHESGRTGELSGTADQLARLGRCSAAELVQALTELRITEAADVSERNGTFTIRNRRMRREAAARKCNAERQKRHRDKDSNGSVTVEVTPKKRGSNSTATLIGDSDFWNTFLEKVDIPKSIDAPELRKSLLDWLRYKAKKGQRYTDPKFVSLKVAEFESSGAEAFVSAVNSSIGNNYAGIFPAKGSGNGNQRSSKRFSG